MRALLILLLLIGSSAAQDLRTVARQKFDLGRTEFAAQHYDKALGLFRDSYQLAPYPDLLFNIARCYEAMHKNRDALDAYERYLVVNPTDEEAQRRASEMRVLVANEPPPSPEPVPSPSPEPPVLVAEAPRPTPVYKKWWLWTAVVGVAAVAVGVGLGVGLSQPQPQRTFPPLGSP